MIKQIAVLFFLLGICGCSLPPGPPPNAPTQTLPVYLFNSEMNNFCSFFPPNYQAGNQNYSVKFSIRVPDGSLYLVNCSRTQNFTKNIFSDSPGNDEFLVTVPSTDNFIILASCKLLCDNCCRLENCNAINGTPPDFKGMPTYEGNVGVPEPEKRKSSYLIKMDFLDCDCNCK